MLTVRTQAAAMVLAFVLLSLASQPAVSESLKQEAGFSTIEQRGQYLFRLAGCMECHTADKGEFLAGGRAFETPFGTFYSPNITSHPHWGIGSWSLEQFQRALHEGVAPDGSHYYPVFPYPSYTQMLDDDVVALWAYLQRVPAVAKPSRAHQLKFPFQYRPLMWGWKWLFFDSHRYREDSLQSRRWNRGAYLVRALGHCGECHTPRNLLGGIDKDRLLAGNAQGPDGDLVPNITPASNTGIGHWQRADLQLLLEMGMLPDGDFVGASMAAVVDNSTRFLTPQDQAAMIEYLMQIPAIEHDPESP